MLGGEGLTVNPSEELEGLAPQFEERMTVDVGKAGSGGDFIGPIPSGSFLSVEGVNSEVFEDGQSICLAAGRSIADLKSAGTVLAWLLVQATMRRDEGPWRWVSRVAFEALTAATGSGGPLKAASFPMRRGLTEGVFEALKRVGLREVSSADFSNRWAEEAWLYLCLQSTSSLAGSKIPLAAGSWTKLEERGAASAKRAIKRLLTCRCGPLQDFEKVASELRAAKVDYNGEETGVCEPLTLRQVMPALPPLGHGGSIALVYLVGPATREILENPEKLLKTDFDHPKPKIPGSVHFGKGERLEVCEALVRFGICEWIKGSEVVEVRGQRVLNGLFGVRKPATLASGEPILRVIMNLKATNSVMHQIRGAVEGLPAITAWQAAVLDNSESFHYYQSDISSAFYLFELPRAWLKFLAFAVSYPGETLGKEDGVIYHLACRVLPMGMHSSVSLMQEVSEQVLWAAGLDQRAQIRRGLPVPRVLMETAKQAAREQKYFWQVYLDNFMGGDRRSIGEDDQVGGSVHKVVEDTWSANGIISSEKKRVSNEVEVEELGALLHGEIGIVGGSPARFCKLIQATLCVLGQKYLNKKMIQIIAGRWIHVLQFRRPGMSFLDSIWQYIGKQHNEAALALRAKRELVSIMGAIPLLHTFMGAEVDNQLWCSDASEKGGAVGVSRKLTPEGMDFVMSSSLSSRVLGSIPILVIGLFSGIGGTFRIYDVLDVIPRGAVAVDIHPPANRIVSRRWPGVEILRDVQLITREDVAKWRRTFHTVEEVHLWGGFPCRDLSSARAGRLNLQGSESSLFFEFVRIWELLCEEFPSEVEIKIAAENVASMDESASNEISEWLECRPYHLDPSDTVPLRRPRLCWTNADIQGCLEGVSFVEERRWTSIEAKAPFPSVSQWLTPGFSWPGEKVAQCFPTCMRAVWKDSPPSKPAGIHRADHDCRSRWAAAGFVYPPYQFREEFLLWKGHHWRLTNSGERELLMGYGFGHTELAWSASKIKGDPAAYERERCSLVGDAFSIYSFVIIGAGLCRNFIPTIHYRHLCQRMGLAPGFRAALRLQAPLARKLQYGCQSVAEADGRFQVKDFNLLLLGRTNFTGSDVRVVSGNLINPRAFPRQPVRSSWFVWEKGFHTFWPRPQHINQLELKTVLLSVLRGIRSQHWTDKRVFHLSDSYVSISVIAKGRSSSKMLNRLLKILNAHLLLHNVYLIMGHIESTENPTDAESRR